MFNSEINANISCGAVMIVRLRYIAGDMKIQSARLAYQLCIGKFGIVGDLLHSAYIEGLCDILHLNIVPINPISRTKLAQRD